MGTLTTAIVGPNVQNLAAAPVAGAAADSVLIVNLDTANTVNLGSSSTNLAYPLGPLASAVLTAPVYAKAATVALEVGIAPGGVSYSPGSLTISGPVTAEISGPVTVEGTVDIGGTTDVQIQNANIDVVGAGGFINPGQIGNLAVLTFGFPIQPATSDFIFQNVSVSNYASIVFNVMNVANSSFAAGAAVCAIFHIFWLDSLGNTVAEDTVSILNMPAGGQNSATWEIPVKGSSFSVLCQNVGTVGIITITSNELFVDGSYRIVPNIRALVCSVDTTPTLTGCLVEVQNPPVYQVASWLASIAFAWTGANANVVFPLPQWAGEVTGFYQITTTALAKNATIVDLTYAVQGGVVAGASYQFGIIQSIPSGIDSNPVPTSFNLPPTQCAIIIDTPATAGGFAMSLIGVGN